MEDVLVGQLQAAACIYRLSPLAGKTNGLSKSDAMICAGIPQDAAETESFRKCLERILEFHRQEFGSPIHNVDKKELVKRSLAISDLAECTVGTETRRRPRRKLLLVSCEWQGLLVMNVRLGNGINRLAVPSRSPPSRMEPCQQLLKLCRVLCV
jgi:hypothetical protein